MKIVVPIRKHFRAKLHFKGGYLQEEIFTKNKETAEVVVGNLIRSEYPTIVTHYEIETVGD